MLDKIGKSYKQFHEKVFTKSEIQKQIFKTAFPAIAEQIFMVLVGIFTMIAVGHLGNAPAAGVGFINQLFLMFQAVFTGLGTGTTAIVAREIGMGNVKKSSHVLLQSLIIATTLALLITIIGYIFLSPIITALLNGAEDPDIVTNAIFYFGITLVSLIGIVIDLIITAALRAAKETKISMFIEMSIVIILLVLLTWLVPVYGVLGAGIAVTTVRFIAAVLKILYILCGFSSMKFSLKSLKPDFKLMKRIISYGIPSAIEQLCFQGGFFIMAVMMSSMGKSFNAFQFATNINGLQQTVMNGFQVAAMALVGQSLGEEKKNKASVYSFQAMKISQVFMGLFATILFIFANQIIGLYTADVEIINISANILRFLCVFTPLTVFITVYSGVLRTAGDVLYVTLASLMGLWLFRVLFGYILGIWMNFQIIGIIFAMSMDFVVRSTMYIKRIKNGKWKYISI